jgi:Major Facilitator Superfamily
MASSVGSIPTQLSQALPATFRQALFIAVTAGLGYGFDSYAVNIYGLVLPDIKKTLHITDAEAGYIGSIFLLGYTIGTIGFGFAADRWGRKTTLGAVDSALRRDDCAGRTHDEHRRLRGTPFPHWGGRCRRARGRRSLHC